MFGRDHNLGRSLPPSSLANAERAMHRSSHSRALTPSDCHPEGAYDERVGTRQWDYTDTSLQATEPGRWRIALVQASFVVLFILLSPIYYLNRWDVKRKKKRNPFYTSILVRLQ